MFFYQNIRSFCLFLAFVLITILSPFEQSSASTTLLEDSESKALSQVYPLLLYNSIEAVDMIGEWIGTGHSVINDCEWDIVINFNTVNAGILEGEYSADLQIPQSDVDCEENYGAQLACRVKRYYLDCGLHGGGTVSSDADFMEGPWTGDGMNGYWSAVKQ